MERTARTKAAAESRLKLALRDRVRADAVSEITPDTKVEVLAEAWYARLAGEKKAPTTLEQYRRILDRHIIPNLGNLAVRELTIGRCDRYQQAIGEKHGAATAKMIRSVLSGICGLGCRHNALASNPMRDVGVIRGDHTPATALTAVQARQLRAYLTYDDRAISRDLPDFVDMMLATSLRIGECAAIHWPDVDLSAATVTVRGKVVRLKGQGLIVLDNESSKLTHRVLRLPTWAVEMLKRRRAQMTGEGLVFPAPLSGKLRDPSNTQADLRDAFVFAGLTGLTSHVFRKTVATLMDLDGRTARAVSDQLGHAQTAMAQNRYMGRQVTDTGAAEVLEGLAL